MYGFGGWKVVGGLVYQMEMRKHDNKQTSNETKIIIHFEKEKEVVREEEEEESIYQVRRIQEPFDHCFFFPPFPLFLPPPPPPNISFFVFYTWRFCDVQDWIRQYCCPILKKRKDNKNNTKKTFFFWWDEEDECLLTSYHSWIWEECSVSEAL